MRCVEAEKEGSRAELKNNSEDKTFIDLSRGIRIKIIEVLECMVSKKDK